MLVLLINQLSPLSEGLAKEQVALVTSTVQYSANKSRHDFNLSKTNLRLYTQIIKGKNVAAIKASRRTNFSSHLSETRGSAD